MVDVDLNAVGSSSATTLAAAIGVLVAVLAIYGALTWRQGYSYTNLETLWRATLAQNADAWIGIAEVVIGQLPGGAKEMATHQAVFFENKTQPKSSADLLAPAQQRPGAGSMESGQVPHVRSRCWNSSAHNFPPSPEM